MKVATVSVDKLKFLQAIKAGSMTEIIGWVEKVGNVKTEIQVKIFVETSYSEIRENAVEASFYLYWDKNKFVRFDNKSC